MPGLDKQVVQEVMYDIQQAERRLAEPSAQGSDPKAGTAQVTCSILSSHNVSSGCKQLHQIGCVSPQSITAAASYLD